MHIDTNILITWGAVSKKYKKNEYIFYEDAQCRFYHQILDGKVKMCCHNEEGKVFIQGVFENGESFGEPPIFLNEVYPASAVAESDCSVLILSKDSLFKILKEYPELQMNFIINFAKRIYVKSKTNKNIINIHPEQRILGFLNNFKKEKQLTNVKTLIPYTRQEIADFLGLRVETVIRTIKKMEEDNKLEIRKRKLYF
ncbi:MAG: Crp/Fnr family transcriptional regulator [Saprospiraceae bacterium]|nr:Crp/Fnr family transcriptional regulator [Saprospiraceae bacterium]